MPKKLGIGSGLYGKSVLYLMARHLLNSYDDRREVFDMTENKRHLQHWNAGLREVVSLSFFASNPNAHKSGFNSWR